jgi:hypothetical protein
VTTRAVRAGTVTTRDLAGRAGTTTTRDLAGRVEIADEYDKSVMPGR